MRTILLLLVVAVGIATMAKMKGRALVADVLTVAGGLIADHPYWGVSLFVVLAAISAMLAFFSSAVMIPVAIHTWGGPATLAFLWLGWLLGGLASYAIGRVLGEDVVHYFVRSARLDVYRRRLSESATFPRVLLFHLAVPSELPGYVLGLLRYPFWRYVAVLAIAEVPFAIGAVYLGRSFVKGNVVAFMAAGGLGIAASAAALRLYGRLHQRESKPPSRGRTGPDGFGHAEL